MRLFLIAGMLLTLACALAACQTQSEQAQEIQDQLPPGCTYFLIHRKEKSDLHMIRCDGRPTASLFWSVKRGKSSEDFTTWWIG